MRVVTCFSQNKDELIIALEKEDKEQYIRAHLSPANTCLSFPENFQRKKTNTATLFGELSGEVIVDVVLISFERAFYLVLESGKKLLFKMHGSRSNILLYEKDADFPVNLFRKGLVDDRSLELTSLEKNLDLSESTFKRLEGNATQFLPTLGKVPRAWLKAKGYLEADLQSRWKLMQDLMDMLETPLFQIYEAEKGYILTMLPIDRAVFMTESALEATNVYFKYAVIQGAFEKEKLHWQRVLEDQRKKTLAYLKKSTEKLNALIGEDPPSQLADIIMANLHQIPQEAEKVMLFDFYNNEEIEVSLKRGVKPQLQAENLYRKSKNRNIEIQKVQQNIAERENYLLEIQRQLETLAGMEQFKELRQFLKDEKLIRKQQDQETQVPFKKFEIEGFEIWVGKSAKANDEMLRNFAWKDDLWLHAKDVSGSHVIIKQRSGLAFPKNLIERAAELAAYYSKNKNESLAPVMYTPCKYVRKVKGSAPGAVAVDREKVVMVVPKGVE